MKLFHILTVTPIDVESHELPAVQYGDYYVASESLARALEGLKECGNVIGSSEVYGAELSMSTRADGVIVRPESNLNQRESLQQHRHWATVQTRYSLMAQGAETPEQFVARRFAENHPQYA